MYLPHHEPTWSDRQKQRQIIQLQVSLYSRLILLIANRQPDQPHLVQAGVPS
jgi:hypothetical protein